MKFVCFLLLCVVSATYAAEYSADLPSPPAQGSQEGIIERLKQDLINFVKKEIEQTLTNFENFAAKVISDVGLQQNDSYQKLLKALQQAKSTLESMKNFNTSNCYYDNLPYLSKVMTDFQDSSKQCVATASDGAQHLLRNVGTFGTVVNEKIQNFTIDIVKCTNLLHPIETTKCYLEQLKQTKKILAFIIYEAKAEITMSSAALDDIRTEGLQCINKAVEKAQQNIVEIIDKVEECFDKTQQATTVPPTISNKQ